MANQLAMSKPLSYEIFERLRRRTKGENGTLNVKSNVHVTNMCCCCAVEIESQNDHE